MPGEHMFQRVEISDLQLNGIERWFRDGFLILGRFSMEEKVYMGIFSYGTYFSRLKSSEIVFTTKLRAFHRH